ncbi:nuclear transport factor 2 family protein [Faunimonas pinastri]|nr:nuclear transport factor 2 family protein [Faunimonas pinastri]
MTDPLAADQAFFTALQAADSDSLNALLSDDFILVDVLSGSTIPKSVLVGFVGAGDLVFNEIERDPGDLIQRDYEGLTIIIGRTRMNMTYEGETFTAESRYTHVLIEDFELGWQLVSAQGTLIPSGAPDVEAA